jgi:hypothetical protein
VRLLLLVYEEAERELAREKLLDLQLETLPVSDRPDATYHDIKDMLMQIVNREP